MFIVWNVYCVEYLGCSVHRRWEQISRWDDKVIYSITNNSTLLHPLHFILFLLSLLLCTVQPMYLNSYLLHLYFLHPHCSACFLHFFFHTSSVLLKLTFIPLLSSAYLHSSRFSYTWTLPATTPSANIIIHECAWKTSLVNLSVTKKGLKADSWCSPASTWSPLVTLTTHLIIMLPS